MKYNLKLLLILGLSFSSNLFAQNLFESFTFQMPIKKAKKLLIKNAVGFKNLSFGDGTEYAIRKKSLVDKEGKLVSINIGSKKNLSLNQASVYLNKSKDYFESKMYITVYAQEHWSDPLLVDTKRPCIRFVDVNKTVLVEIDPRGQGSVYNVFITFYNYDWFLQKVREAKDQN